MASPSPKPATKGQAIKKEFNIRLPSSSPNPSTKSLDSTQRPSYSCPSLGPPSPPYASPGPPPLPPTYSLANLAPEEIGWYWEAATLGPPTIASFPNTTIETPLGRYLRIRQRYEMIALGLDTGAPIASSPGSQGPVSLNDGSAPPPVSPSQSQERELSSSWSSISTICSAVGTVGDENGDDIELDEATIRLKLAELNRKRARGKPRIFKQARMKRRDARKKAKRVEDSKVSLKKGEEALGNQFAEEE